MASVLIPITGAHADGVGPEMMGASLLIMPEAGARLALETIEIGDKMCLRSVSTGIELRDER